MNGLSLVLPLACAANAVFIAAEPPSPLGTRIDRPALFQRHASGLDQLSERQLADELDRTAANLRALAQFRFRVWDGRLPERERAWSDERMREQSELQRRLDRFAEATLQRQSDPSEVAAPEMYEVWYMPFPEGVEGIEWELARARANLGAGLAYLLRARASLTVRADELAAARSGVERSRAELERAERDAAAQASR